MIWVSLSARFISETTMAWLRFKRWSGITGKSPRSLVFFFHLYIYNFFDVVLTFLLWSSLQWHFHSSCCFYFGHVFVLCVLVWTFLWSKSFWWTNYIQKFIYIYIFPWCKFLIYLRSCVCFLKNIYDDMFMCFQEHSHWIDGISCFMSWLFNLYYDSFYPH